MPCLVRYKSVVRNDFFGDLPGVVGVHGEPWREFRSRVQKPVLQLTTVRRYVRPLEEVTDFFIERCQQMLDQNQELPDDFDNEIHKWSLECKCCNSIKIRFFDPEMILRERRRRRIKIRSAKIQLNK